VSHTTEITVSSGARYQVEGHPREIERVILDAARGSLMELAWMVEAPSGEQLGVNPEHVMVLRAVAAEPPAPAT
jgi:hypothetical protein